MMATTTTASQCILSNEEPLISSLHELVDKNNEMQTELLRFHAHKMMSMSAHTKSLDSSFSSHHEREGEDDGIPKDSVALNRRLYNHFYDGFEGEDDSSDAESTAEESYSECDSFGASLSSLPSTVAPAAPPAPKRVRFATTTNDNDGSDVLLVHYSGEPEAFTDEERCQVWYSSQDFRYFKKYSKKLASIASSSSYVQELDNVWKICDGATTQDVTHCCRIANTAVRGLEAMIASEQTLVANRRTAVRGVLEAQASFGKSSSLCGEDDEPNSDKETVLCNASLRLSRSARLLARILGNGDAAVARAMAKKDV